MKLLRFLILVAAALLAPSFARAANFYLDNFTGSAGTVLSSHTGDLNATYTRVNSSGTEPVLTGSGGVTSATGTAYASSIYAVTGATPASADYSVSVVVSVGTATGGVQVNARQTSAVSSSWNAYSFQWGEYNSGGAGGYTIAKIVGGAQTILASDSTVISAGSHTLKITVSGSTISGYVDGTQILTTTDSSITAAGFPGLWQVATPAGAASGITITQASAAPLSSALTSGTASLVSTGATTASVTCGAASGGTSPYSYQWYRSTTNGFTPGGGNIVSGATSLTLNDTGLASSTTYYYKLISTDNVSATVTSNQVTATTTSPSALVAPVASNVSVTATTISLTATAATGGTSPYTYQWYRATTSGFTPGGGNILSGKTTLSISDTTGSPGTNYYYKIVGTDSAAATATSNQVGAALESTALHLGFIGDSITNGAHVSNFPGTLAAAIIANMAGRRTVTATNQGVPSSATGDWISGSTNLITAKAAFAAAGVTEVNVMLGVNDSNDLNAVSAATYKSNLQSMIADLVAAGYVVRLNYPTAYSTGATGFAYYTQAALERLRGYLPQIDSLINGTTVLRGDTSAFSHFLSHPDQLYSDEVHLNDTGNSNLANMWAYAITRGTTVTRAFSF